jgi:AmiR/NasT family two-component response regulator
LLHEQQEMGQATQPVIDQAKGILVARNGCTSDEALTALTTAAQGNELTIDLIAECLVADQDLR